MINFSDHSMQSLAVSLLVAETDDKDSSCSNFTSIAVCTEIA